MRVGSATVFGRLTMLAALGICAGCGGDGLERQPVSGTVTFEGQPLEAGQIQFFPEQANEIAIMSGGLIEDGAYSLSRAEGLVPGKYIVRISAASGEDKEIEDISSMPGTGPLHAPDLIPAKYNSDSTLNVEITEGANEHDFTLTK